MKKKTVPNSLNKEKTAMGVSRRDAIKFLAGAGAAVSIVPSHVLGGGTVTAPSDKINMALIGAGKPGPCGYRRGGPTR